MSGPFDFLDDDASQPQSPQPSPKPPQPPAPPAKSQTPQPSPPARPTTSQNPPARTPSPPAPAPRAPGKPQTARPAVSNPAVSNPDSTPQTAAPQPTSRPAAPPQARPASPPPRPPQAGSSPTQPSVQPRPTQAAGPRPTGPMQQRPATPRPPASQTPTAQQRPAAQQQAAAKPNPAARPSSPPQGSPPQRSAPQRPSQPGPTAQQPGVTPPAPPRRAAAAPTQTETAQPGTVRPVASQQQQPAQTAAVVPAASPPIAESVDPTDFFATSLPVAAASQRPSEFAALNVLPTAAIAPPAKSGASFLTSRWTKLAARVALYLAVIAGGTWGILKYAVSLDPDGVAYRDQLKAKSVDPEAAEKRRLEAEDRKQREADRQAQQALKDKQRKLAIEALQGSIAKITIRNSKKRKTGQGTGFVIDKSGLMATNYHVIDGASSATAEFSDGTRVEVVGCRAWDAERDLAILELAPRDAPYVPVKLDVQPPRLSDKVFALGHPQGLHFSTADGIVSGVPRTKDLPPEYRAGMESPDDQVWVQSTTLMTGGNSGGPLIDEEGDVIGVNTWIAEKARMGFSSSVKHLVDLRAKIRPQAVALSGLTGPAETIAGIQAQYASRVEWFSTRLREAKNVHEFQDRIQTEHPALEFSASTLEFIRNHPDAPARWDALVFLFRLLGEPTCPTKCEADFREALALAEKSYSNPKQRLRLILTLNNCRLPAGRAYLEKSSKLTDHPDAAGIACFCLGMIGERESNGEPEKLDQAIGWFERISEDYPDAELPGLGSLKLVAAQQIHRLKHLEVGREALEIDAADMDGRTMKLSDYRGKVVVLDFWVDWCPHCRKMYPFERDLVTRYADQPFALLGVNCEANDRARVLTQQKMVTWKNWLDGQEGEIAEAWQVNSFPTVYVIDAKGIIRHKGNFSPEELEAYVVALLEEQTGKKPAKKSGDSWLNRLFSGEKKAESSPRTPKAGEPGSIQNPLPLKPRPSAVDTDE